MKIKWSLHSPFILLLRSGLLAAETDLIEFDKIVVQSNDFIHRNSNELNTAEPFQRYVVEERQYHSIQDIAPAIPNLNVMDSGMRSFSDIISIRGLSHTPFANNSALQIYVDDVPYGGPYSYANQLLGVESVEVFRGPQNAAFGANAYGGVIKINSPQPGNEWKSYASVGGGNYDAWFGKAYSDGAIVEDELYLALGGAFASRDGYLTNQFLGNHPDNQQQISARSTLTWTPNGNWDVRFMFNFSDFKDGAPRLTPLTDPTTTQILDEVSFDINSDLNGQMDQTIDSEALRISYLGEGYDIVSVTSRRNWNIDPFLLDSDFTSLPIAMLEFKENQRQWTEDLRIRSNLPDSEWDWSLGFFFSSSELNGYRNFTFSGLGPFPAANDSRNWRLEEDQYALLGELAYQLNEQVRLFAGLRLDYVNKSLTGILPSSPFAFVTRRDNFFASPKFEIDFQLNHYAMLYASTGLAYKPGGFRPFLDKNAINEFDSEKTWANEVGFKWSDDNSRARLAFFYYRIEDYQVERFLTPFDLIATNADDVESYGVELELKQTLWKVLTLESNFGYNRVEFGHYRDPVTGTDFSGNRAPFAPEFNLMLAAEYRHPIGYFARAEGIWTGETFFDQQNTPLFSEGSYAQFNARIGFEHKNFAIYAFGNNLTNTEFYTFKIPSAFAGTPGIPRSYGLQLSLNY